MSQFDHLKALHVTATATADFIFEHLEGMPSLTCRPATDINEGFFNAVLKAGKQASRKAKAIRKLKGKQEKDLAAQKEKARLDDIELFVDHIVVGWDDVVNKKGKPVEFTTENLRQFLQAIPPEMFHDLRVFCLSIENFRPDPGGMSDEEREDLSGN